MWKAVNLGGIETLIIDGDRGKNYPSKAELSTEGHCLFLNTGNVTTDGFDFSSCQFITPERDALLRKGKMQKHDCVITTRGTVGNVAFWGDEVKFEHIRINSGMVIVRPNQEEVWPRYLAFFLRSKYFRDQISGLTSGSAQPQLPIRDLRQVELPLPSIPEQREIASILGTLDDKIELNRRMSATLEEMARSLYRSWFVDFDPVHAKMEGRQPAFMDEATAALFPERFGEDGLPEGWEINPVSEFVDVRIGKTPPRKEPHHFTTYAEGTPWLSIKDMGNCGVFTQETSEAIVPDSIESCRVATAPAGTIFLSFKMTVGRVAIASELMATNEAIAHMNIKEASGVTQSFLFFGLKLFDFSSLSSTSSIANAVNSKSIRDMQMLLPSQAAIEAFDNKASVILEKLKNLTQQNQNLAALRDSLLPKLMSGELRVSDARNQIDEVA